ncbi:hypothetical protein ACFOWT_18070 [Croceibacterium xixiisoli]|uniref:hypothetical protein n=1 Tax=Croceibacterium xixiisoli TaxID=1476466 RepID=UPI001F3DE36D|nr:hypothetical protein [Croceibacterium xixiisoli]
MPQRTSRPLPGRPLARACRPALLLLTLSFTVPALANDGTNEGGGESGYPHVPEPMVFDMMRPLGAKKGELEANTLAVMPLSGDRTIAWAPEVEYAFADGFAVEAELPFEDGRLAELKLGLQAAWGSFNGGKSAHGVQYLGIYDRHSGRYSNTLVYMLVHRFDDRWSSVNMVGLDDISLNGGPARNAAVVNHSTFYDAAAGTVLGVEINFLGGHEGHVMVMPQWHQKLGTKMSLQAGLGAQKDRGDALRPRAGLRLIREF